MTIKIIFYKSVDEFNANQERDFSPLHIDFVLRGVKVTWVNGTDDPRTQTTPTRSLTQKQFIDELAKRDFVNIV